MKRLQPSRKGHTINREDNERMKPKVYVVYDEFGDVSRLRDAFRMLADIFKEQQKVSAVTGGKEHC